MVTLWASQNTVHMWPVAEILFNVELIGSKLLAATLFLLFNLFDDCWKRIEGARCNERLSMTALNWQTMQDTNLNAAIDRTSHCVNRSHLAASPGLAVNFFTAITMTIIIG